MLTAAQLKKIMPRAPGSVVPILNDVAKAYGISNERRMAAWLATLAIESGEFRYQEEIASGAAYENRADLGNTQKGDGRKFKGHGRIQLTGRANHQSYTNYLKRSGHLPFVDFIAEPKKLAQEPYATDSAGWFWAVFKKLNGPADSGDFLTTQIKVNGRNKRTGKPNHWRERNNYFLKGLSVLPDDFSLAADSTSGGTSTAESIQPSDPQVSTDLPANDPPPINSEPVTLTSVTTSIWTKIVAAATGLTGIGINAGTILESQLSGITFNHVLIILLGVAVVVLAVFYYKQRQQIADIQNAKLLTIAADPTLQTVELKRK